MLSRTQITYFAAILPSPLLPSLVIAVENPAVSVSGIVQDNDGTPVHGARIFVIDAKEEWSTKTSERGTFDIKCNTAEIGTLWL